MSVQVSYKKQITLGICLMLILMIVVESVLQINSILFLEECDFIGKDVFDDWSLEKQKKICLENNSIQYNQDHILLLEPNQQFETISINSHGFRGDEISDEKNEDYRIIIIGGSTVFGAGSSSDQTTIPAYLEEFFKQSNFESNIEIINGGIPSAYSYTEEYLMKNSIVNLKPDLVIVYDGGNDAAGRYVEEYKIPGIANVKKESLSFFDTIKQFVLNVDYKTPIVITQIISGIGSNFPIDDVTKKKTVESWENRLENICEHNEINGISTIIAIQPLVGNGEKPLSKDELAIVKSEKHKETFLIREEMSKSVDKLSETCDVVVDLKNIFDNVDEPIFYDHVHTSDKGNYIISERIFEKSLPVVLDSITVL